MSKARCSSRASAFGWLARWVAISGSSTSLTCGACQGALNRASRARTRRPVGVPARPKPVPVSPAMSRVVPARSRIGTTTPSFSSSTSYGVRPLAGHSTVSSATGSVVGALVAAAVGRVAGPSDSGDTGWAVLPASSDALSAGAAASPPFGEGVTVAAAPTLPPGRAAVTIGAADAPLPVVVSAAGAVVSSGRASASAGDDVVNLPVVCSASPVGRVEPVTDGATSWDTGLLNTSRSTDRIGPATPALARWRRSVPVRTGCPQLYPYGRSRPEGQNRT